MLALASSGPDGMQMLARQIAVRAAPASASVKDRIRAGSRATRTEFVRFREIYYGNARRIDVEEADRLRAVAVGLGIIVNAAEVLLEAANNQNEDLGARLAQLESMMRELLNAVRGSEGPPSTS